MEFTNEQTEAIQHSGSHALITAVPGSGKTRTLVARVIWLIESGTPASRIRIVTFNKSAADEFADRLGKLLPSDTSTPEVSTFHSLALRLCKYFESESMMPRMRLETDEGVLKKMARKSLKAATGEMSVYPPPTQDDQELFVQFVDLVKAGIDSPEATFAVFGIEPRLGYFARAFEIFEQARRESRIRFFSDLQRDAVDLLLNNPLARQMIQGRIDYLMVDEFQDASAVQIEIVKAILGNSAALMAVGDDDQSIYGWRGARPDFMLRFAEFFPGAKTYSLSRTFRFGHSVALSAGMLIKSNQKRIGSICIAADTTPNTQIRLIRSTSKSGLRVADAINRWVGAGRTYRECAILSRLWGQTIGTEFALLERDVPYYKPTKNTFDSNEIMGILGYLRLAAGTLFEHELAPSIVSAMLSVPTLYLTAGEISAVSASICADPGGGARKIGDLAATGRNTGGRKRVEARALLWKTLTTMRGRKAAEILNFVAKSTAMFETFAKSASRDVASDKEAAFDALLDQAMDGMPSVEELLARIDRFAEMRRMYRGGGDCVLMTTIHQSKGSEWPHTILLGLEAGKFPSARAEGDGVEEERRLAYVGMTRAQEVLSLVVPPDNRFDAAMGFSNEPVIGTSKTPASTFANEMRIQDALPLAAWVGGARQAGEEGAPLPAVSQPAQRHANQYFDALGIKQRYEIPEPADEPVSDRPLEVGDHVEHTHFGRGEVVGVVNGGIVQVRFGDATKHLVANRAPMERIINAA